MLNRALVLEDHSLMQTVFKSLLLDALPGITVSIANTLKMGLALAEVSEFDIALVDLSLPDGSGVELIRKLKKHHNYCYVVVMTIFDDELNLVEAFEAGADGYLLKDQTRDKLIAAIRGIDDGEVPLSPVMAKKLISTFKKPAINPVDCTLSQREQTVLSLIGKGYKNQDVAQTLGISENTVAAHLKSVYKKLNISSRAEACMEATKLGLISV